jgi:hypothetical protein
MICSLTLRSRDDRAAKGFCGGFLGWGGGALRGQLVDCNFTTVRGEAAAAAVGAAEALAGPAAPRDGTVGVSGA